MSKSTDSTSGGAGKGEMDGLRVGCGYSQCQDRYCSAISESGREPKLFLSEYRPIPAGA